MIDLFAVIFSGVVGGIIGALASILVHSHGYLRIEKIERRKQKISLLDDLMASRYALLPGHDVTEDEARDFNRAMARIPHVFAENKKVIAAYDAMLSGVTDDRLIRLLMDITEACGLAEYAVSHAHLVRVQTIRSSR